MSTGHGESVWSVKYGERVVRKKDVFHDYGQYGLPDGDLDMDYNFWVIRAGGSVILMDTGYDIAARDWLGEISVMPTPDALKLIGVDPLDVDMVITSHFHYDHIGYLGLFERAQVVSGQKEYDYWFGKRAGQCPRGGVHHGGEPRAGGESAQGGSPAPDYQRQTEVFPGITVFQVGGHCPGEIDLLAGNQGATLVTGQRCGSFL